MITVVDLREVRMRKLMTPKEAFDDALARYECEEGGAWETPLHVLELFVPAMSAKKRKRVLQMLEARIAGYTPEMIANAQEKIRLLKAAELLLDEAT
jgi:hypothetical protein